MKLGEFWHMGGYAVYVWTSYALALVVLVGQLVQPILRHRRLLREVAQRARRERAGR
jgi:heme exporter protein D